MHQYVNQRDAYSFDKVLALAEQYGLYFKAVMMEKNDRILQTIGLDGQLYPTQDINNFYGNGTTVTKVRWLQQAWWRYMQARWGYSPHIHSWELVNEGGPVTNHYILTDEFGKYMHCRLFGQQPINDPVLGIRCNYDHPNSHLVTTSFYGSNFAYALWNNGANAGSYKLYRDVDYADQHKYADEAFANPAEFFDSALYSYNLSTAANFTPNTTTTRKPFIRGEAGYGFATTSNWSAINNPFSQNLEGGEWLHDYIWAGINAGGLMEQYFAGGYFTDHIYNIPKIGPSFDHRPMFKTYYDFIKDIPLSNGKYQDASASASLATIRAWGQKDVTNKRAHLWIANKNHTWYNVMGGYAGGPTPTTVTPQSGTVTIAGFNPNTSYRVEWWDTYSGAVSQTTSVSSNASGVLSLAISNLVSDTAVRIGDYSPNPSNPHDLDGDGDVDFIDIKLLFTRPFTIFDFNNLVQLF